jgi:uncharacterized protein
MKLGVFNNLKAVRSTSVGFFLSDDAGQEVLLPNKYVPEDFDVFDTIDVFVYKDSEDRIIATNLRPYIELGQFACLRVEDVGEYGAFVDWGLEKHLLIPFKEQARPLKVGDLVAVHLLYDQLTERLVGSTKTFKYLEKENIQLSEGQEVQILVAENTDLGYNVIVNNQYKGLVYRNEVFKRIYLGDILTAYVKRIRPDKGIDIILQQQGYANTEPNAQRILSALKENNGYLPLSDASNPEQIYKVLEMSKKTFKKSVGNLYRDRKITIADDGIRLL